MKCLIFHTLLLVGAAFSADLKNMDVDGIVPDLLDKTPDAMAEITYANDKKVDMGNELTPTEVKDAPTIKWNAEANAYYTVLFIDIDAPSRATPTLRSVNHWLVGNVLNNDISKGDVIVDYLGSGPFKDSGLHRYVTLIYKQPKKLEFDEPKTGPLSIPNRLSFDVKKFAKKYELGDPIAGNFYKAQWDPYVDERSKTFIHN